MITRRDAEEILRLFDKRDKLIQLKNIVQYPTTALTASNVGSSHTLPLTCHTAVIGQLLEDIGTVESQLLLKGAVWPGYENRAGQYDDEIPF